MQLTNMFFTFGAFYTGSVGNKLTNSRLCWSC